MAQGGKNKKNLGPISSPGYMKWKNIGPINGPGWQK